MSPLLAGLLGGFVIGAVFSIAVYHHALAKVERAYDELVDKYNEIRNWAYTPWAKPAVLFKCNTCGYCTHERRHIHDHAAVLGHHGWAQLKR